MCEMGSFLLFFSGGLQSLSQGESFALPAHRERPSEASVFSNSAYSTPLNPTRPTLLSHFYRKGN